MCFSATASYTMSGVLGVVGATSIMRSPSNSARLFAAIPLLFGAQQFAEGTVWETINAPPEEFLHRAAVSTFLALAFVVWPMWAPLSIRLIEQSASRRKLLNVFVGVGVMVAVIAGGLLLRWQPTAHVVGHSIDYKHAKLAFALPDYVFVLAYAIPTVASFFLSTSSTVRNIGVSFFLSMIVAFAVERHALTSVWCFFAAVLSVMIVFAVSRMRQPQWMEAGGSMVPQG